MRDAQALSVGPPVDLDRERFAAEGYAVVPDALDDSMIDALRRLTDGELDRQTREHFEQFQFHGSMLALDWSDVTVRKLLTWPKTLQALRALGFDAPKWMSGYIISKPPRSPSLWWHQDWWAWDEPDSFGLMAPQLFVMYYLTDVTPENGCLRVIPGSHRTQHPLHTLLPEAHSPAASQTAAEGVAHRPHPDEISVLARAGDAVIGDVRLLHATHANTTDRRRTCLTLWYLPAFAMLSERIKAYVIQHPSLPKAGWWRDELETVHPSLRSVLPTYEGSADPAAYNRTPPVQWPDSESTASKRR